MVVRATLKYTFIVRIHRESAILLISLFVLMKYLADRIL